MKFLKQLLLSTLLVLPISCWALTFPSSLTNEIDSARIDASARKLVVFVHGWNPQGHSDKYQESTEWFLLKNSMRLFLNGTDWKLVAYHWESDANTGAIDWSATPPYISDLGYGNAITAAGNANLHGSHLGEFLNSSCPNLRMVHFVAHSAGSWAAREAMKQLLARNPYVVVQLTLLDPFIPDANFGVTSGFSTALMSATTAISGDDRIYRLENYYAQDISMSTEERFSWRSRDINQRIDHGATLTPGINLYYDDHAGPIFFFSDTVQALSTPPFINDGLSQSTSPDFTQFGWSRSLAYEWFLLPRINTNPQSQTVPSGTTVTLNVAATDSRPLSYQWFKNGTQISGTDSTYSFAATASSAGDYAVRVSNVNGLIFSDKAVVAVNLPPSAPSSLSAAAVSSSQINLSWSDRSSNETGFKVERRLGSSGTWAQIASRAANVATYSDTGRAAGTLYQYRVRAYNASGDSDYSGTASATTQPAAGTTHTLTIASVNPSSGAGVSSYVGTGQYAQGTTPTSRSFAHGSVVGVNVWYSTLPSGQIFQKWQLDGVDYAYTTTTSIPLDDTHTLTAIYGATPPVARTLTDLTIEGPSSVDEGCAAQYKALASYSDGSSGYVIASWGDDSSYASISSLGLLDADAVSVDEDVVIDASFTAGGVTRSDSKSVTIYNTDAVPTYTLTLSALHGQIIPRPIMSQYPEGTQVRLVASEADGYLFDHWSGDASGTVEPVYVTMSRNKSVTATFTADTSVGDIRVFIYPAAAVSEGATWKPLGKVSATYWQQSGDNFPGIPPGDYTITFSDIPNWITPDSFKLHVPGGPTIITNATYREILGAAQITITPAQACIAGARWRIDGGPWTESGVTRTELSTGNHTVDFLALQGWGTPTNQTVAVARGTTSVRNVDYLPPAGLPIITAVSPRTGPIVGGTTVTIDGANFQTGASVFFGGVAASSVTVVSPSRITAVSPPRTSYGSVSLSLTSGGQTVNQANGFSYLNALGSNIELVGQIGGNVQAVAVVGNMAYYGEGPGLVVSDFANSAAPVERGRIALPMPVQDVFVVSNVAFVAVGSAGLYAVDVSTPSAPSIIGFFDTEGAAMGVCVSDGFAYVGDGGAGLQILNVTNPTAIVRAGILDTAGTVMRVTVGTISSRKYAFLAEGSHVSAMRVIDVTTPNAPVEVTNVTAQSSGGITDVKLLGTTLYMSDWSYGVKIFNASNPSNLVQTGNFTGASGGAFLDVVGNRLYAYAGGLMVADLTVMPKPTRLGSFDAGMTCYKLVVASNLAFVATGAEGLKVVNVINPAAMSLRSTIQTLGSVEDVWVSGSVAYVGNDSGLHTLDVSTPAHPLRLATLAGARVTDIVVASGKATLVNYGDESVRIANVANPASLVQLGTYTNVEAWNVALMATTPVLAAATRTVAHLPKIDVLNITSPSSPQSGGSLALSATNGIACGIAIAGNWAFVGREGWGEVTTNVLDIINLANPASPQKVGSLPIPNFSIDIAASVDGNYVYVPLATGIQVVDVNVKTAPVLRQIIDPPQTTGSSVWHVEVANNRLFAVESGILFVFDISSPASPLLIGYYDIPSEGCGIAATNDLVFIAGYNAGVTILHIKDVDKPTVAITSPTVNSAYSTTNVVLSIGGTATDDKGVVRVTWLNDRGGGGVAQGTTTWAITNLQLAAGLNRVTLTAEDADGNLGTDMLDITATFVDATPPVVTITGPKPDSEFTVDTPTITLSGSAVDNQVVNGMTCSNNLIAAGVVALTGQTWSVTNLQLSLGPNLIQVTATDASGNSASDTAVIFFVPPDTNGPVLNIEFPTLNSTYETGIGAINLSGTAADESQVSEVNWISTGGTQGVASGVSPWSANSIPLQPGFNLIEVSAKDAAGNVSSDTLSVTYTPPPLTVGGFLGVSNGVFGFELAGPLGGTYVIETSSNLVQWAPFSSNTIPGEDSIIITDPGASNCPIRFYRATSPTNSGLSLPALNIAR